MGRDRYLHRRARLPGGSPGTARARGGRRRWPRRCCRELKTRPTGTSALRQAAQRRRRRGRLPAAAAYASWPTSSPQADPAGQRTLLAEPPRRPAHRHGQPIRSMSWLSEDDRRRSRGPARPAADLARTGDAEPVFDALAEPAQVPSAAARTGPPARRGRPRPCRDGGLLPPPTTAEAGTAMFYLAVGDGAMPASSSRPVT